jgi:hypothetical protein
MDFERFERWVTCSRRIAKIGTDLQSIILSLGRLDSKLITTDRGLLKILPQDPNDPQLIKIAVDIGEHLTFSYLWILGIYEFVRTLDARCRSNPEIFGAEINKKINNLKNYLSRLRVPLAKLQPEEHHISTDYGIAFPAIGGESVGWIISPDTILYRQRFSNKLLHLLEEIH